MGNLPVGLLRSITLDQGSEMARPLDRAATLRTREYLCDWRSPSQRGSSENDNRLIGKFFPKGTDLVVHTPDNLFALDDEFNRGPRNVVGDPASADLQSALLASSAGEVLRR